MFEPTLSHIELFTLNNSINELNYQLSLCQNQIDQTTGLIAAYDNDFSQSVFNMGKSLPNLEARKLYLYELEKNNPEYQQLIIRLNALKNTKVSLLADKDYARNQVSIGLSEHKSHQLKLELELLKEKT